MPSAESFGTAFALKRGQPILPKETKTIPKETKTSPKENELNEKSNEKEMKEKMVIVRRVIGHLAVVPNRVYRYPIELTISSAAKANLKRKREEKEKQIDLDKRKEMKTEHINFVKEWFGGFVAGEANKRMVWTFYGNPYDIWVEDKFTVQTNAFGQIILKATGHGTRNLTAPKKPSGYSSKTKIGDLTKLK